MTELVIAVFVEFIGIHEFKKYFKYLQINNCDRYPTTSTESRIRCQNVKLLNINADNRDMANEIDEKLQKMCLRLENEEYFDYKGIKVRMTDRYLYEYINPEIKVDLFVNNNGMVRVNTF